jgi:hypothetical protein
MTDHPPASVVRNAFSRLSRMIEDFVTRLALASPASRARRSSGSVNEIVRMSIA